MPSFNHNINPRILSDKLPKLPRLNTTLFRRGRGIGPVGTTVRFTPPMGQRFDIEGKRDPFFPSGFYRRGRVNYRPHEDNKHATLSVRGEKRQTNDSPTTFRANRFHLAALTFETYSNQPPVQEAELKTWGELLIDMTEGLWLTTEAVQGRSTEFMPLEMRRIFESHGPEKNSRLKRLRLFIRELADGYAELRGSEQNKRLARATALTLATVHTLELPGLDPNRPDLYQRSLVTETMHFDNEVNEKIPACEMSLKGLHVFEEPEDDILAAYQVGESISFDPSIQRPGKVTASMMSLIPWSKDSSELSTAEQLNRTLELSQTNEDYDRIIHLSDLSCGLQTQRGLED